MPRGVRGRKKAPGVGAGEAANLLSAIHEDGLDERKILRIIQADKTPCDHVRSACRVNRKDNVACFCQLVPAETSSRKKGLWQKEQAHLESLGYDSATDKREDPAKPSGLRNLGNTCYANAALQCLFSIPSLRNGIFNAEAKVASHDIFRQLQVLFLQMQFGPRSNVDTEDLAKALGLDHAVQQDGQEFMKLLLMRVEQMLSKSNEPAARGLVQRLFRGGLSYVTTCQRCGRDSASSKDVQDFYDLLPQVRGFTSLMESLAAILHADVLTGDNRYRCEFCTEKVDALRHVRLRSLPPYLCLALQRFYFDPRTADKAKALDKFRFPLLLDFQQVLATAAEDNAASPGVTATATMSTLTATASAALEVPQYATGSPLYELVAILIHKGSQANSGHYVAHIKDQASGQWWRFDDETADYIGTTPTAAFQSDHGSIASTVGAAGQDGKGGKGTDADVPRKRVAIGDPGEDPDYDHHQEACGLSHNEDDEATPKAARGGRAKKQATLGRSRARPSKRPASAGCGRVRRQAPADEDDTEDDELMRAMKASLQLQNGAGVAAVEDEEMRLALHASLGRQGLDAGLEGTLAESARLQGAVPKGCFESGIDKSPEGKPASTTNHPGATAVSGTATWTSELVNGQVVSANAYMLVYRAVGFEEPPAVAETSLLPDELQMAVASAATDFAELCNTYERKRQELKEQVEARQRTVREVMNIIAPRLGASNEQQMVAEQPPLCDEPVKGGQQDEPNDLTSKSPAVASAFVPDTAAAAALGNADAGLPLAAHQVSTRPESPSEPSDGPVGYWVSTAWLEQWANAEGNPLPIDNNQITCTIHGAASEAASTERSAAESESGEGRTAWLNPAKAAAAKLVSPQAWRLLLEAHGGGPTLAAGNVCRGCLVNQFSATLLGSQAAAIRSRVANILDEAGPGIQAEVNDAEVECMDDDWAGEVATTGRYFVSRLWLQGWSRRQGTSIKAEKSPTADITCPHGLLLPASVVKTARRVVVPADVWNFLKDLWRQQRMREAPEARSTGSAAGVAPRTSRGNRTTSRSNSATVAEVDCLDLTGEGHEPGWPVQRGSNSSASPGQRNDGNDDDDDHDCLVEELERMPVVAQAASSDAPADMGGALAGSERGVAARSSGAVPTAQQLDALCPELQVGRVHECRKCMAAAGHAAEMQADTKRQIDTERTALGGLASEVMPTLEPGAQYYLVPSAWVREWQNFVRPVVRRAAAPHTPGGASSSAPAASTGAGTIPANPAVTSASRPKPLTDAMLRMLCPCHPGEPRLGVPIPRLAIKRNKLYQQDPEQDAVRVIQASDWWKLRRMYVDTKGTSGLAEASHRARREHRAALSGVVGGVGSGVEGDGILIDVEEPQEAPVTEARVSSAVDDYSMSVRLAAVMQGFTAQLAPLQVRPPKGDHASGGSTADIEDSSVPASALRDRWTRDQPPVPELLVWPPVCPEALAEHSRVAKEAILSYREVDVMVELISQEELEVAFRTSIKAPERKSRRSRKGRFALTVSNTTTLEQLKLQIYEQLSIHPRNQALYGRGEGNCPRLLEGDALSLAQHEVLPGDEIRVVRQGVVDDDDDMVDLLGKDAGRGKRRQMEEGFKNTALHGDLPLQQQEQEQTDSMEGAGPSNAPVACISGQDSEGMSAGFVEDGTPVIRA